MGDGDRGVVGMGMVPANFRKYGVVEKSDLVVLLTFLGIYDRLWLLLLLLGEPFKLANVCLVNVSILSLSKEFDFERASNVVSNAAFWVTNWCLSFSFWDLSEWICDNRRL